MKYCAYLKKVFKWIDELSKIIHVSKYYLLIDYIFAATIHGCLIRQYCLGNFWAKSFAEREKCLTYPRMCRMMKHFNKRGYIHYLNKKVDFNNYFAEFVHRHWIYVKDAKTSDFMEFMRLFKHVIIKPVAGVEGGGIRKIDISDYNDAELQNLYVQLYAEDVMVEELIVQHPDMVFGNTSVNTIRTMTIIDKKGRAHVQKAILRAGVGNTDVDNYAQGGSIYEVDLSTGVVCTPGKSKAGLNHFIHPGTDRVMLGYKIPHWDKVIETSCRAAELLPEVGIVGWDIAITETGTDLIEGNHNPDYELYEYLGSNGYYEKMEKYL